jgi:hypothetical protein
MLKCFPNLSHRSVVSLPWVENINLVVQSDSKLLSGVSVACIIQIEKNQNKTAKGI